MADENGAAARRLLGIAQRLQALGQAGLAYQTNAYDRERYEEIRLLSARMLQELTDEPLEKIVRVFGSEGGYQTPKMDIRAVVFRGVDEVLMVRERIDGDKWTLPGGWAEVGSTPFETAVKETREETGLVVRAKRLLALFDKRVHAHPPQPWYAYKAFIECVVEGGEMLAETGETSGARWFRESEVPLEELSVDRVTAEQIETMFRFARDPGMAALCD